MFNDLFYRLRALFQRKVVESEMDDELHFHFEQQVEKYVGAGIPREKAVRHARLVFGGPEQVKEECRDARGVSFAEALLHDLRFGARMLRKTPGFSLIAVLTLALGIGASTAVFSVVNAILLKPLPYPAPGRIMVPSLVSPLGVIDISEYFPWHPVQFLMVTREQKAFQDLGAFENDSFNLTNSGEPVYLDGFRVSAGFFTALGISPALGRVFTIEEDRPGRDLEVILSHQLWQERFGGDANILGRSVRLNGYEYTVIGVMPAGFLFPRAEEMPPAFNFPKEAKLWVPLAIPENFRGPSELAVIGRLKTGVSIEQAQADMNLVTKHAETQDPRWKGWFNTRLVPLSQQVVEGTQRPVLLMLGAVGVVLLIACSNVANLSLTRSIGRSKEFTLRTALGAARGRLVRQLLTESLLLAMAGGVAGTLLAEIAVHLAKIFGPSSIPRLHEVSLDFSVLLFALTVTFLVGILFGLAPALGSSRANLVDALKQSDRRIGGNSASPRTRNLFLVAQVALALVLVISSGLLLRSFSALLQIDGGFNAQRVLTFQLSLPASKYPKPADIVPLYRSILDRLRSLPGVQSAGIGETVPMGGEGESTGIRIPDHPAVTGKELLFANYTIISPGYLSAAGTSLLRGRDFEESDVMDSLPVTLINSTMAKKFWPGRDPLGKQVGPGDSKWPLATIIGVVADAKHVSLREETAPEMYVPYSQKVWPSMLNMRVLLRTQGDPASIVGSAREAVQALDPDLPLAKVSALTTIVDESLAQPRFSVLLLGAFGALALALASVGMYGLISYSVMQRTQEIGIRMALGAARPEVLRMILNQGARLAGLGIAIGLLIALGVTRLMTSFLFGVRATDPLTFAGVSLLLAVVILLACYLPARRATRVDPVTALRYE